MSEAPLLPPLITDYASAPAGGGGMATGGYTSGWSRGGTMGFGTTTPGRFGAPSFNSFFTQHTANPKRVTHFKGLLGVPICTVNDEGYFCSPRFSFQYQPNTARSIGSQSSTSRRLTSRGDLKSVLTKSAAGNKQWGTRTYSLRRTGPPNGFIPDVWRDELRAITDVVLNYPSGNPAAAADSGQSAVGATAAANSRDEVSITPSNKPTRKTQYSTETGRIVPSKLVSSPRKRWTAGYSADPIASRNQHRWTEINEETQADDLMLQMLCQVLQTSDIGAVQAWLISAHDREKAAVIEMIRSALDTSDVQELLEAKAAGRGNDQPAEDWTQPASNADGLGGKFDR